VRTVSHSARLDFRTYRIADESRRGSDVRKYARPRINREVGNAR
jgi:hypothetical protein